MEIINQDLTLYSNITSGTKHQATIICIEEDHIIVELFNTPIRAKIKFSHIKFPDLWLSSLIYRKINEIMTIKIMHITTDMEVLVVPTDILGSFANIKDKSINLIDMQNELKRATEVLKSKIKKLNDEANDLTQKSITIFRSIKELNSICSKNIIKELKSERSEILKQRKEINSSIFDLLTNLRSNESELENLENKIEKELGKSPKLQHI